MPMLRLVTGLVCAVVLLAPTSSPAEEGQAPFSFERLAEMAERAAAAPFEPPAGTLPDALAGATYDAFRKLRFRPDRALWRGERLFEVQFFHLGFLYRTPVRINVVKDGRASGVAFDPNMFEYGDTGLEKHVTPELGYAGFRVHFPLHRPDYKDEVVVFLGASYFRPLGRDQRFGASARGLAVDVAMPRGEEFPLFREFWIEEPGPEDTTLTLYALLDSARVTGAYRFVLVPGTDTVVEVTARLFARGAIDKLGIAPLTSMFLFGESGPRHFDDFRPGVHDSDGLLMLTGAGRWLWRPLRNPGAIAVSAFEDRSPRGFGLMQRERAFERHLDLESQYHRRPSLWVEPVGDWGEGWVELVEIPSKQEIHDNIVASWTPRQKLGAGDRLDLVYRLHATQEVPAGHRLGRAVHTRLGSATVPGSEEVLPARTRLVVVDFEGGDLSHLSEGQPVTAEITCARGEIVDVAVLKIPDTDGWRAAFRVDPRGDEDVELMLRLSFYGRPITEDWMYRLRP